MHTSSMSSIFRTYVFTIDTIEDASLEHGIIRVKDVYDNLFDLTVKNKLVLPITRKQPELYTVIVSGRDCFNALIKMDPTTKEYPPLSSKGVFCEIITNGVSPQPSIVSVNTLVSNSKAGKCVNIIKDETITNILSDIDYDPLDIEARNKRAAQVYGVSVSSEGGINIGSAGESSVNISQSSGFINNNHSVTNASQETSVAGGMMTTSLNFLQHYMIGIGNAVALPMPHMVNLIKMVSIGKFVKQVIGVKGKRVDNGDGTTHWENGSGMYGLGDTIVEIAKKKE